MTDIAISVNPTYRCNNDCEFCYLRTLHNSRLMDLDKLNQQLADISLSHRITYIDVYGGEISLMSDDYNNRLLNICERYTNNISIVTNMVELTPFIISCKYPIGTSYDGKYRPNADKILKNIDKYYEITGKKVGVLVCSPNVYNDREEILDSLNRVSIKCFRLIPCMKTVNNGVRYDFKGLEDTIKYFITHPIKPYYNHCLDRNRTVVRHVFINPDNQIIDVNYDKDGYESFNTVDLNASLNIPNKCLYCKHFNRCLNEHCEYCIEDDYDCIGCYKLIDWYDNNIDKSCSTMV